MVASNGMPKHDDLTEISLQEKEDQTHEHGLETLAEGLVGADVDADGRKPFDIVAVHGIFGHREGTWTDEPTETTKPWNWLRDGDEFSHARVLTFGYQGQSILQDADPAGFIRDNALELLRELSNIRETTNTTLRPLAFIGHDLGGTIIKEAVGIATLYTAYRSISDQLRSIVFFGCPHTSEDSPGFRDCLTRLLISGPDRSCANIAAKTISISKPLTDTNGRFATCGVISHVAVVNVFSDNHNATLRIFDKQYCLFGFVLGARFASPAAHAALCKVNGNPFYKVVKHAWATVVIRLHPTDPEFGCFKSLNFPDASAYPHDTVVDGNEDLEWIIQQNTYQEWLEKPGPSILQIQARHSTSIVSNHVYHHMLARAQSSEHVCHFRFCKNDDRRNSIPTMLKAVLSFLLFEMPGVFSKQIQHHYLQMVASQSCTIADLMRLFTDALHALQREQHPRMCFILEDLAQCDHTKEQFLSVMLTLTETTERTFKLLFINNSKHDQIPMLQRWPKLACDEEPEYVSLQESTIAREIAHEVADLLNARKAFKGFSSTITDGLSACGSDRAWRRLLVKQLMWSDVLTSTDNITNELKILPPKTLDQIIRGILDGIPPAKRQWAHAVLLWISYAFRPLTLDQLDTAIALQMEDQIASGYQHIRASFPDIERPSFRDLERDLEVVLKGLVVVQYGEVHFCHPSVLKYLTGAPQDDQNDWHIHHDDAHEVICRTCVAYLKEESTRGAYESFSNPILTTRFTYAESSSSEYNSSSGALRHQQHNLSASDSCPLTENVLSRSTFVGYAVWYWPKHYTFIEKIQQRPLHEIVTFARQHAVFRFWIREHWLLQSPLNRTDRSFVALLPIFANLGLFDVVDHLLETVAASIQTRIDYGLALVEGARNAHLKIVQTLLALGDYSNIRLQEALTAAVSCGVEAVLEQILLYVVVEKSSIEWPTNLLCCASLCGYMGAVRILVNAGIRIDNPTQPHGCTALYAGARHGHSAVVEILLKHKASLSARTQEGHVPLTGAAYGGCARSVKLLVDAGADLYPEASEMDPDYPIAVAARRGNFKVVRFLAESGLNRSSVKSPAFLPLGIAILYNNIKCAQVLLENGAQTEITITEEMTPLRHAVAAGYVTGCALLLDHGADAENKVGGEPILHKAAVLGNVGVVRALLEHGALVDSVDEYKCTGLQRACWNGHKDVVAIFLDHDADVDHLDITDQSSLYLAASAKHSEIVQMLIDKGADKRKASIDGWRPEHAACTHLPTLKVLLNAGASFDTVNKDSTILSMAVSDNKIEEVKLILRYYNDRLDSLDNPDELNSIGEALMTAICNKYNEIVRLLIAAKFNVNFRSRVSNVSFLQIAVLYDNEDALQMMLDAGVDLEAVDSEGETALNSQARVTSLKIIKLLVVDGANINTRNDGGYNPLARAVMFENLPVVRYLVARGADVNVTFKAMGSPLHIACLFGSLEILEILVAAGAQVDLVVPSFQGTPLQSACRLVLEDPTYEETQEKMLRFLLDVGKADIGMVVGFSGSVANTAAGWAAPSSLKLLLERGAVIDIPDQQGRYTIHYAASRPIEQLRQVLNAGGDIRARDKAGRTVLNFAIVGGFVDVVENVLNLASELLEHADMDGWTPLMWAARGVCRDSRPSTADAHEKIVRMLIDRNVNPCIGGKVLDEEWSVVKVARYHGANEAVVRMLIDSAKKRCRNKTEVSKWDGPTHESRRANRPAYECDGCLWRVCGLVYTCKTCTDYGFCVKCYATRHVTHPDHGFEAVGPEFEEEPTQEDDDSSQDEDSDAADAETTRDQRVKAQSRGVLEQSFSSLETSSGAHGQSPLTMVESAGPIVGSDSSEDSESE